VASRLSLHYFVWRRTKGICRGGFMGDPFADNTALPYDGLSHVEREGAGIYHFPGLGQFIEDPVVAWRVLPIEVSLTAEERARLLHNLTGLSLTEAERILTRILIEDAALTSDDIPALRQVCRRQREELQAAMRTAERMSPVVLWIDEFRTFLSWLQERQGDVFVVATSNDVSQLPPEFIRKGRFDEVFAQRQSLTTVTLLDEIRATRPLSRTMSEQHESLRRWARDRTVDADGGEASPAQAPNPAFAEL